MTKPDDPRRDPGAVIADIEQAFQSAGYETVLRQAPADSFTVVIALVFMSDGRQRQAIAVQEEESGNIRVYLSKPFDATPGQFEDVELVEAQQVHYVTGVVGVGEDIVKHVRRVAILGKPADPAATDADLREALSFIANPRRNSGSGGMGSNVRGDDLASLANAMLRIMERLERLEARSAPDREAL
jgi:hypothetical protein